MRKVLFYISLVLGFSHTLDATALEVISTHICKIAQQESTHFSQKSPGENVSLTDHLIDIEEDEITDPARDKFSLEKTAVKNSPFVTSDSHCNFFNNILANQHFYHRQPSHFISLRVLKI